jgi:hypothetical protein
MSADDEGFTDMNPPPETGIFNAVDRHSSSVIQIDNGKALNVVAILRSSNAKVKVWHVLAGVALIAFVLGAVITAKH